MRIHKILAGSLLLVGLASCNNENGNDDNGKKDIKNPAYAQFAVVMSNTQSQAKSSTTPSDDGTNIGTTEEQTVQNVNIIFIDGDGAVALNQTFNVTQLTAGGITSDQEIIYTTPAFPVEEGTYTVYAGINLPSGYTPTNPNTDIVSAAANGIIDVQGGIASANNFMMSTTVENAKEVTLSKATNTENAPYELRLNVDRTAAKISYDETASNRNFPFKVTTYENGVQTGEHDLTTTLTAMNVANRNMTTYVFGREDGDYVVDPNFDEASVTPGDFSDGTSFDNSKVLIETDPSYPVFYCMENTDKEGKEDIYYTGIFFQAQHEPSNDDLYSNDTKVSLTGTLSANGTFYRYGNYLFGNLTDLEAYLDEYYTAPNNLATVKELLEGSDQTGYDFLTKGKTLSETHSIDVFYEGHSYYLATIGHTGAGSSAAAPYAMQYGVVRNTWYKVKVSSISGLGSVVPEFTEEPVDPENASIKVEILINPWNVVLNDFAL